MLFALQPTGARSYYPFRFFDDVTKKWTRARYVAELHVIAERYAQWEITGPPEIRTGSATMLVRGPGRHPQATCRRPRSLRPTTARCLILRRLNSHRPSRNTLNDFSRFCSCVATSRGA